MSVRGSTIATSRFSRRTSRTCSITQSGRFPRFPIAHGVYYGVDYGITPAAEADLSWYRNIPVPTSYMAAGTQGDFFGGYDHSAEAASCTGPITHISPGKKQWTWGNDEFGYAWDRELTDADGPYVELMAGVYTDNQPDFSFLMPYETKTFSQYWYPIQRIGPSARGKPGWGVELGCAGRVGPSGRGRDDAAVQRDRTARGAAKRSFGS